MGDYLNPGNELFRGDFVNKYYIDKSGLIKYTNSVIGDNVFKCMCVSRPRRFGKSFAADMLTAYYDRGCDSHALFDGLDISQSPDYETHINKYDVIYFDAGGFFDVWNVNGLTTLQTVSKFEEMLEGDLAKAYPEVSRGSGSITDYLSDVYEYTNTPFVFVIDEWDAVFRVSKDDVEGQKAYLKLLNAILKQKKYVALAYMTGILPIKKYGTNSALNMFKEYTMLRPGPVKKFIGLTEDDVKMLCVGSKFTIEDIKDWYDGYTLDGLEIYNSNSVVSALSEGVLDDYWNKTEMFEDLLSYITVDVDGLHDVILKLLAKETYVLPSYNSFQNDLVNLESKNDYLVALIHLGYLSYDSRDGTLKIPNHEVRIQFVDSLGSMKESIVAKFYDYSNKLL
ncbi:MAG: AAA family ATPase, partial [Clostridia bacterium]|nr:AAA family ATPase [Clostridia bacterium]